jgi:hypothetical protein
MLAGLNRALTATNSLYQLMAALKGTHEAYNTLPCRAPQQISWANTACIDGALPRGCEGITQPALGLARAH